ncbi:hypothetical protein KBTX_04209 [wastewater metagenome]|uniref:Uncharacterized protein n=2 Tax=unclassified sequences TaxID=12908 RepID=A0A5B8RJV0_9ZZZZ|nr:hypothetical protein KBTEX_04209 [uncultured organism]
MPRLRQLVRAEPGLQEVMARRPVDVVPEVLLAGPDDLDRGSHGAAQRHRLGDVVLLQSAPEATADQCAVHADVVPGGEPQATCHAGEKGAGTLAPRRGEGSVPGAAAGLGTRPDLDPVVARCGGGVGRLEAGMGLQWDPVTCAHEGVAGDVPAVRLSALPGGGHVPVQRLFQDGGDRRVVRQAGRWPFRGQSVEALPGFPVAVGDDGDGTAGQGEDILNPRDSAGGPGVHPDGFPAGDRRMGDTRDQGAATVDVDAEHRGPGELLGDIPPGRGVADPAPFPRFGERDLGGRFEPGRVEREGAVGQAAAAGVMMDVAVRGAAVGVVDAPAGGGGGDQQRPCRGRAPAEHGPRLADAGAAAGGLLAVDGGEGRGRELDGVRRDGELLGDKQGQ